MKQMILKTPVLGPLAKILYRRLFPFEGSQSYWANRYASGGNSGEGSYGAFAEFKAKVLNDFVAKHSVASVIEFGCGDGNQLTLAQYPSYTGFDISKDAVEHCKSLFSSDATKAFKILGEYAGDKADLALSLDVILHLVEDSIFEDYMQRLFSAASRFVILYSPNEDRKRDPLYPHVRYRQFTQWIEKHKPEVSLIAKIDTEVSADDIIKDGLYADFYIYQLPTIA